jgi:TRAP-type uncharacterized transport system substrate-binding protein
MKIHADHPLWIIAWVALAAALLAGAWAVLKVVSPTPPRTIHMSTGVADGAYHQFGLKYQAALKANGITLVLQPSTGSVENLQRLNNADVEVGFVQGGLGKLALEPNADDVEEAPLRSLATIGYEPVWIFSHTLDLTQGLGALRGKKIAVGVAGSGNYKVALELLTTYGLVDAQGKPVGNTQLVTEGGTTAAAMLQSRALDAAIVIASPQAAAVKKLLGDPAIKLASLAQAEGLARRFPYFQTISLKRGSADPARNLPPTDVTLLTTTANLVIHENLHPALAYLLLEAARQIHSGPSLLARPGVFPNPQGTDFPLSPEAERYFKNGRPFLQTYLPFWLANFVQRFFLIVVPVIAIFIPIVKVLPTVLDWRQRRRLYRYYGELKFLERDISQAPLSPAQSKEMEERLVQIEQGIAKSHWPNVFADRVYTLRQHVDYVRGTLRASRA